MTGIQETRFQGILRPPKAGSEAQDYLRFWSYKPDGWRTTPPFIAGRLCVVQRGPVAPLP